VITCVVEYVIDPAKIDAFERFGRRWIELVNLHGGTHHGYFLPAEGASDRALALFSFPSLAAYEQYRALFGADPDFIEADRIRDESGCVLRYQRSFMRPVLPEFPARLCVLSTLRLFVQVLVHLGGCDGPFADCGGDAFDRAVADVAGREYAGHAGL
jgi:hypothetical protein